MLAEGHLDRVEHLHDHQDQQELVQHRDDAARLRALKHADAEDHRRPHEQRGARAGQQHRQADIDHVLDAGERLRDPFSGRRSLAGVSLSAWHAVSSALSDRLQKQGRRPGPGTRLPALAASALSRP